MKKKKKNKHNTGSTGIFGLYHNGDFIIKMKSTPLLGKLINVSIPPKGVSVLISDFINQKEKDEILFRMLEKTIAECEDDEKRQAYKQEQVTVFKRLMKPMPHPTGFQPVRMRVIGAINEFYRIEPADKIANNILTKLGY